ncbi:TrkH-domain-containing protein, partial [Eremomyces bilateralis CBS 781.70]
MNHIITVIGSIKALLSRSGPVKRIYGAVRHHLPEPNFLTWHYTYFITVSMITAIILWGSSTPEHTLSFTDALFLCVSAVTEAGLVTVDLSTLNTFQQIVLFGLIMVGSVIFVSIFVVHIRLGAFKHRFKEEVEIAEARMQTRRQQIWSDSMRLPSWTRSKSTSEVVDPGDGMDIEGHPLPQHQIERTHHVPVSPSPELSNEPQGRLSVESEPVEDLPRRDVDEPQATNSDRILRSTQNLAATLQPSEPAPVGVEGALQRTQSRTFDSARRGRNHSFFGLSDLDKKKLGGCEYRALKFLGFVVPLYSLLWQLLSALALGAWMAQHKPDVARRNGINPWWLGAFNAVSAFNNSGMSLLDLNMVPFQYSIYVVITMGLLILVGNTAYPIVLRLFIWMISKIAPDRPEWDTDYGTLRFLLDHPRRCYTYLFPSTHTWWLLLSLVVLNTIDCVGFIVLNIGNKEITSVPPGIEFLSALFQAIAVRQGGFSIVSISASRASLQVLYLFMMYINAYPVVIVLRNSNIYEERSLGIYADDTGVSSEPATPSPTEIAQWFTKRFLRGHHHPSHERIEYFVRHQFRAQLAHDVWLLILAVFLVAIIESPHIDRDPSTYSMWAIIFEVVSAYATVGVSLGFPNQTYSFCGGWRKLSKLVLCGVMMRGRHRGLPVAIDKAVMLPREGLMEMEEEDRWRR